WRGVVALFAVGLVVSSLAGAFAYFLPVALVAYAQTGLPGRSAAAAASPGLGGAPGTTHQGPAAPAAANGGSAFTVLLLGSVDDWVWVGLRGLVRVIDYLGGVDVTTSNPVLDDFYPADLENADPYAYKRVLVLPGPQHLDGIHAMEYVRSRHGDVQEDFGRSQRQQQVLLALKAKAKGVNPTDLPGVVASF